MYHTLAKKHKMSFRELFSIQGQEFELKSDLQDIFPSKSKIASTKKVFLLKDLSFKPFNALNRFYLKKIQLSFSKCSVENCTNTDIEMHHIRALKRELTKAIFRYKPRWVKELVVGESLWQQRIENKCLYGQNTKRCYTLRSLFLKIKKYFTFI